MSGELNLNNLSDAIAKDIIELQKKIQAYNNGKEDEERFKHFRLTRGVYGQRQLGVHMFRTKIPYGRLTADQLIRLADVSDKYTNGNLHLTTRQNIQMHYVKLKDSPAIWTELGELGVTAREACGNTVRNLTASAKAGIDPDELFDVSPYVEATFRYFLRNPICQEMGRKIKPAFSSSDKDSAFTYFHDFGFIPRIKTVDGIEKRGFKVVVGGGLGAQPIIAPTAYEFLPEEQLIPFTEAAIRVFDRYGERERRHKARMKYLVKQLGLDGFLALVEEEKKAIKHQEYHIDRHLTPEVEIRPKGPFPNVDLSEDLDYNRWVSTNAFIQKQEEYYGVQVRVPLGNISSERARLFAAIVKQFAADDIRITVNQGFLLRFISPDALPHLYLALKEIGLALPGFDSLGDITACPGTDTCNLGVTNSTALAIALEEVVQEEYPHLISASDIKIKISGCMNSCGQHMAAQIGLHGSSIKKNGWVLPAMQIVLGGGVSQSGEGFIAERVIKLPSRRIPDAIRIILDDYEAFGDEQYFNVYYQSRGKRYYYDLLKKLADVTNIKNEEFIDWGEDAKYEQAIGVGECVGAALDMVSTILDDAKDKIVFAEEAITKKLYADSIYHAYSAMVIGAKALLLAKDVKCNTHSGIIKDFQEHYIQTKECLLSGFSGFSDLVLQINANEPTEEFSREYYAQAKSLFDQILSIRSKQLDDSDDKEVINNYYNA